MGYEGHLELIRIFKTYPNLQFYIILGNHDKLGLKSSAGHSLELLIAMKFRNVRFILDEETINVDGANIHFMPWPCKKFSPESLNIAHIEVRGSQLDSGRKLDSKELVSTSAVACIGHLHTSHKVKNAHFSGTLYQTNFGEPLKKYFHHIRFNSVEDYEIQLIPHKPKYRLYTVIVHSKADLKAISRDPFDLIKLVIEDGADISQADYDWPNVVAVKAFKSKSELTAILTEDLEASEELVIRSTTFFDKWISVQDIKPTLKKRAITLRKEILRGDKE